MTRPVPCRCDSVARLEDDAAIAYSSRHLRLRSVAPDARSSDWECPVTGARWREAYRTTWAGDRAWAALDRVALAHRPPTPSGTPRSYSIPIRLAAAVAVVATAAVVAGGAI